ncbi:DUF6545 domain-containing protein [Streptomyces sp. NPDC046931]|uniref:DUF6545 domain-containing protein n=1 Tax=Streptomyces sp. NPDC046931 TaxID=3154806 RepID=UPI0033D4750E
MNGDLSFVDGDLPFYVSGGLVLLACLLKLPVLIRARGRDWLLSSICSLLFLGAGVQFTTAQSTIVLVNRGTGVPNIAAPLDYMLLVAFSGASIVLVLNWRGGTGTAQARHLSRITIAAYGTVVVLIAVLFALGDAPVEQRTRFDLYYATTPFIREMILLYLTAHAVASLSVGHLCRRWSREVHGTLRTGLRVLAAAYLMHFVGYDAMTAAAVVGRWTGHTWDVLITIARTVIAPSAILGATGFVLPLIGRSTAVRYWQLAPLARTVRPVQGAPGPEPPPLPWWKPSVHLRLTRRQTYISDRILACRDHFDPRIRDEAHRLALADNATGDEAEAIAEAALIVVAVECHSAGDGQGLTARRAANGDDRTVASSDLVDIARALRSRIVKEARIRTRNERRRTLHGAPTLRHQPPI